MTTKTTYNLKGWVVVLLSLFFSHSLCAQTTEYTPEDSALVVTLLQKAATAMNGEHPMVWFGRQFIGTPYVAHTLEKGDEEHLIVNLRELDCTTFVETVTALTLCHDSGLLTFDAYCAKLRLIRYRDGKINGYPSRLHYFTWWGEDNERKGIVRTIQSSTAPFTARQTISLNYMSTHPELYKQLKGHPKRTSTIRSMENESNGTIYPYIPKHLTGTGPDSPLGIIHNGDILSMITSKHGLDTSHIGIAVWQGGKLHLLNASSLYHKVVLPTQTLHQYQQQQKSQTGIRVYRVRVKNEK